MKRNQFIYSKELTSTGEDGLRNLQSNIANPRDAIFQLWARYGNQNIKSFSFDDDTYILEELIVQSVGTVKLPNAK